MAEKHSDRIETNQEVFDETFIFSSTCSLFQKKQMLKQTIDLKHFCSFCYHFCIGEKKPELLVSLSQEKEENKVCNCDHIENPEFFRSMLEFQSQLEQYELDKQLAYNEFLNYKNGNKSIIQLGYSETMEGIRHDIENMQSNSFNWLDMNSMEINKKAELIKKFLFDICSAKLNLLNTICIQEIYTLNFIQRIIASDPISENSKNFSEVLNFDDCLLTYFMKYYIETGLVNLDRIDAVNIESLHPIARNNIRIKNQRNEEFQSKYIKGEFKLYEFAIALINKYVPIKTFKFKHQTYLYGITLFKYLLEYGLVSEEQAMTISEIIYVKLQCFTKFENDFRANGISELWLAEDSHTLEDLIQIRQCYSKIMIHILILRQDNQFIKMMGKVYEESAEYTKLDKIFETIKFPSKAIYETSFGKKMLDIFFGFVISQEKIQGQIIAPKSITNLTDKFLMLVSNTNDSFSLSINLVSKEDLSNFYNSRKSKHIDNGESNSVISELSYTLVNLKKALSVVESRDELINQVTIFSEKLNAFNSHYNFNFSKLDEQKLQFVQKSLNENNIFVKSIMMIDGLPLESLNSQLIENFAIFCKTFLFKNSETQCIFLQDYYFTVVRKLVDKSPLHIFKMIFEVFSVSPRILLANSEYLFNFLGFHEVYSPARLMENNIEMINLSILILKILGIYITETKKKDYIYLPEYDILVGDYLGALFRDKYTMNDLKELLQDPEMYPSIVKEHALLFVDIMRRACRYRFTRKTYDAINPTLSFESMVFIVENLEDLEEKGIFLELFTEYNIDFKNNLLNQRNQFFIRRPVDMQYDEDINFARPYNEYLTWYLAEIIKVIDKCNSCKDQDFTKKSKYYLANYIFLPIYKTFNLYSLIKENDLSQIKHFMDIFKKCNKDFYSNSKYYNEFFGTTLISNDIFKDRNSSKLEIYRCKDEFSKERLKIQYYVKNIKKFAYLCMNCCDLEASCKAIINQKYSTERVQSRKVDISMFSNLTSKRVEGRELFLEKLKNKISRKGIDLIRIVSSMYQIFKHQNITSVSNSNVYIQILNDKNIPEANNYSYNLCSYLHNQLKKDYTYGHKTYFYILVECFTSFLFIATKPIQSNFFLVIKSSAEIQSIDKVYLQMKFIMNFLKHKNTIDKFYKETYFRTLLCLKFHQFLCIENFEDFKDLFKEKNLPDDSVDRVQRFTTIYQRTTDLCEYHNNYDPNILTDLHKRNRSHLILMCAYTFDCLAEFTAGPYEPNQLKIYRYIYDRYNGTLKRYMNDPNSPFYVLKDSLCNFMTAMADGLNDEVINFLTINYEIKTINDLMINSIAQLFAEYKARNNIQLSKGQPESINGYQLFLSDFPLLIKAYKEDKFFNSHTLLEISVKIYKFLNYISNVRTKFKMHIDDRISAINSISNRKTTNFPENDIVVWKFLRSIVIKLDFVNNHDEIDEIFFVRQPICDYLSSETKKRFLEDADRSSLESKIASLIDKIPIFEQEMNFNYKLYNKYPILKVFGQYKVSKKIQIASFIIGILINAMILNTIKESRYCSIGLDCLDFSFLFLVMIEVSISCFGMLIWYQTKYQFQSQISEKEILKNKNEKDESAYRITNFERLFSFMKIFFSSKDSISHLIHILMPLFGLTCSIGFFVLDLFAAVNLFSRFKFIVNLIKFNFNKFIGVYFLGVIIMVGYTIFVHHFLNDFLGESVLSKKFYETDYFIILRILGNLLSQSKLSVEGVKEIFQKESANLENSNGYLLVFILEIIIFMLVNIVILNTLFGITIDSLAKMRENRQKISFHYFKLAYDSQNFCFICNNQKYIFEKSGIKFTNHIKDEHNLWNYVSFIVQMNSMTTKDCNTKEAYILQSIHNHNINWIPIYRSKELEKVNTLERKIDLKTLTTRIRLISDIAVNSSV